MQQSAENPDLEIEMPRFKCHKKVWALKIRFVNPNNLTGEASLEFEDTRFAPRIASKDYVKKHSPKPGGYLVVYEDGYQSFSPAEAFEAGYTEFSGHELLSPSEALFGFVAWLTTREEVTSMGASSDCAGLPELIKKFYEHNRLPAPREDWHNFLAKHPHG